MKDKRFYVVVEDLKYYEYLVPLLSLGELLLLSGLEESVEEIEKRKKFDRLKNGNQKRKGG